MAKIVKELTYTITVSSDEYDIIEGALWVYQQAVVDYKLPSELIDRVNILTHEIERDE